jgi:23S rRNA (uracil1939-C5)-methyltransferase
MRLQITALSSAGEGLSSWEGKKIKVLGALPGEEVEVKMLKENREGGVALAEEIVTPSPDRGSPSCSLFPLCTGCQLQHMRYSSQLEFKRSQVEHALGIQVTQPISCGEWEYRNHARLTVKRKEIGFVNKYTNQFIKVEHCLLMTPLINELISQLQGRCTSTMVSIRVGIRTGEYLIQPELPLSQPASGQPFYHEILLGRRLRISSPSFFQPNTEGAETMIRILREWIGSADKIMDAYAGVGTFSAFLSDLASEVIAVEESPSCERDARFNLRELPNVRFVKEKVERVLPMENLDVLILDPPRQGCSKEVLEAILRAPPKRIVYISCNPWSMGRDLRQLREFRVEKVQLIDLFAQTKHIECMALLSR